MMNQMIADAEAWAESGGSLDLVSVALTGIRLQKAKWALWSVAHERGVPVLAAIRASRHLAAAAPSARVFFSEMWRPLVRMFIPFFLQRALTRLRPCR